MSENDYIDSMEKRNPNLFAWKDNTLLMKASEFKNQIRAAFRAGEKAGRGGKSVFEEVFGKGFGKGVG